MRLHSFAGVLRAHVGHHHSGFGGGFDFFWVLSAFFLASTVYRMGGGGGILCPPPQPRPPPRPPHPLFLKYETTLWGLLAVLFHSILLRLFMMNVSAIDVP